jgi:hypothetical protein
MYDLILKQDGMAATERALIVNQFIHGMDVPPHIFLRPTRGDRRVSVSH